MGTSILPKLHVLKLREPYFEHVATGVKKFEVRKNDRNYKVGDILMLKKWDGVAFTNDYILASITYILDEPLYLRQRYVVLGIDVIQVVRK